MLVMLALVFQPMLMMLAMLALLADARDAWPRAVAARPS